MKNLIQLLLCIWVLFICNVYSKSAIGTTHLKLGLQSDILRERHEKANIFHITSSKQVVHGENGHKMSLGTLVVNILADLCPHGMLPLAYGLAQGQCRIHRIYIPISNHSSFLFFSPQFSSPFLSLTLSSFFLLLLSLSFHYIQLFILSILFFVFHFFITCFCLIFLHRRTHRYCDRTCVNGYIWCCRRLLYDKSGLSG